jgi:hypothetical protein
MFTIGCGSNPTSPTAAVAPPPTVPTATLTVHVDQEAFVSVRYSAGEVGQMVTTGPVRFTAIPLGETVAVTASNNAGSVQHLVTLSGDLDIVLTIAAPIPNAF